MIRTNVAGKLRRVRTPLVMVAVLSLAVLGMPFADAATSPDTEHITVTQELQQVADGDDCMGRGEMTWTRKSLPTTFEIVVNLDRPLCNPYETAAVIYMMPPQDPRWPQTLAEKVDITFYEAGVTTIVWDKFCVPAQFDLFEPPTPRTIAPWGPYHGALVFPATDLAGSNGSAIQYLGGGDHCDHSTTTSTTTTTTTITEVDGTTTSTSEPQVGGSTTTLVETPTPLGSTPTTVAAATQTRSATPAGATVSSGGAAVSVAG